MKRYFEHQNLELEQETVQKKYHLQIAQLEAEQKKELDQITALKEKTGCSQFIKWVMDHRPKEKEQGKTCIGWPVYDSGLISNSTRTTEILEMKAAKISLDDFKALENDEKALLQFINVYPITIKLDWTGEKQIDDDPKNFEVDEITLESQPDDDEEYVYDIDDWQEYIEFANDMGDYLKKTDIDSGDWDDTFAHTTTTEKALLVVISYFDPYAVESK